MPKLTVIKGPLKGQVFDLGDKQTVFCGRYPRMNDISILDIAVSRKHFKFFRIGKDIFVEDLKSKHGTIINGNPIEPGEGFQVGEGDIISVGNTVMYLTECAGKLSPAKIESGHQDTKTPDSPEKQSKKERRSEKELELIYNVSELLKKQLDIKIFFKEFIRLLLNALPRIDNASILLLNNNNKTKLIEFITDSDEKTVPKYNRKILKKVIREHKTVRMSNTEFESPEAYVEKSNTLEIKSVLCVPIISGDEMRGAIYIDSIKPYGFRRKDQLLLNSLVGPIAVAIENNRLSFRSNPQQNTPLMDKVINYFKKAAPNRSKMQFKIRI